MSSTSQLSGQPGIFFRNSAKNNPTDTPISPLESSEQPGTRVEIKRIYKTLVPGTAKWTISDSAESAPKDDKDPYAKYAEYVILVQDKMGQMLGPGVPNVKTTILIMSNYLLMATKDVMKHVQQISWNIQPFEVVQFSLSAPTPDTQMIVAQADPQLFLTFLPQLKARLADLLSEGVSDDRDRTAEHLSLLIDFLDTEYATELQMIENLTSHGEITFDLLWAILIPRSIVFASCGVSSEPRAFRLLRAEKGMRGGVSFWRLWCEYVEVNEDFALVDHLFGLGTMELYIMEFKGVTNIAELNAYPIQWHPNREWVREKLIRRGHKWAALSGVHHMHYNGVAYRRTTDKKTKVKVNGRVMIDRRTFADSEPDYNRGTARRSLRGNFLDRPELDAPELRGSAPGLKKEHDLDDDDFLLASPLVYGFSLVEKLWLTFNVEHMSEIEWNDEVFMNLTIDPDQKVLVQSLVESHARDRSFDDFMKGKGLGLVFNLFGPPGVGKSLTVEATSEHLRKPFYIVSAGDLGTNATTLDQALTKIFALSSVWDAVVLIDEADVFLEERTAFDLERNAMVSVFLRQIEYFGGVLFLTTNRVNTFDRAFQSRIHLSLRYEELSEDTKEQIWRAFINKARNNPLGVEDITAEEMKELSAKKANGRQIKNVVKIAVSLANYEGKALRFEHLSRAMGKMEAFSVQ